MTILPKPYVGTAGWNIPPQHRSAFPESRSHLERYAQIFSAVEVNTSFYRPHQHKTWAKWAAMTPNDFAFCVKIPKAITHEARLRDCGALIKCFKSEVSGLGEKLKALLIQLPPSLALDIPVAQAFFGQMDSFNVPLVLEPRHKSWFTEEASGLVKQLNLCRAAVDPSPLGQALTGIASSDIAYFRLHGSPVIYYSNYPMEQLESLSARIMTLANTFNQLWCIFDNTAEGHAASNAMALVRLLNKQQ